MNDDLISREVAIEALAKAGIENYAAAGHDNGMLKAVNVLKAIPAAQPEIIRCKECKYFKYDYIENVNGVPLIVAHDICLRWGNGVKTLENGYCFLAER